MSILHPAFLYGFALVSVPVILHLLLRQKPKKLIFPALRLIEKRRKQNVRRIRLRHLWLLLLRMLAIAVIVAAIARPSLPPANYALSTTEWLILLGVVAIGVTTYFILLHRWKNPLPRYELAARRSALRGWTTGAVVLVALLAVGWPYQKRVRAEMRDPSSAADRIDLPVTAVFLFDTSLSMTYQQEGKTRLDVAKQFADEHLSTLPTGSRVAIADISNDNPIVLQSTLGSAHSRIAAIEPHAVSLPLNDRLRSAFLFQRDDREQLARSGESPGGDAKDRYLRRVYVFTDLASSAWRLGATGLLASGMADVTGVDAYLVDMGVLEPLNAAVSATALSRNRVARGGSLVVSSSLTAVGPAAKQTEVELWIRDGRSRRSLVGRRTVELSSSAAQRIEFEPLFNLVGPLVQGEVRLVASDPLASDDVRFFTVEVGPPPKVLVIAPDREQAQQWLYTLNPNEEPTFDVQFAPSARLAQTDPTPFDVVCLINIVELPDEQWFRLGQYVDQGGGLAVFLGSDQINPVSYGRGQAQTFLPVTLEAWSVRDSWNLSLDLIQHPVFAKVRHYEKEGAIGILESEAQVYKFWKVQAAAGASVLATYTDDERSPAIVAGTHGKGRVVVFTTAVDQKPALRRWNTFLILENVWAYLALSQQMMEYLGRVTERLTTYEAGESVAVSLPPADAERALLIRRPDLTQVRRSVPPRANLLVVDDAELIGHYELSDSGDADAITGFSVNPPNGESDFTRLSENDLDELLGEGTYHLARNLEELKAEIDVTDLGVELFPIVLVLAIIAFCGEHLVANHFYEVEAEPDAEHTPALSAPPKSRPEPVVEAVS